MRDVKASQKMVEHLSRAAPAANLLLPLSDSCDGISSFLGSLHAFRGPVEGPVARRAAEPQPVVLREGRG